MSNAATTFINILTSIIIVRATGPHDYGELSYFAWLGGTLSLLGILSFPPALTRFVAELRGRSEPGQAEALVRWVTVRLAGFNLLISLGLVIAAWSYEPPVRAYLLALAIAPVMNVLGRMSASALWGRETYELTSIASVLAALVQIGIAVATFFFDWGVLGYLFALLSSNLVWSIILIGQTLIRPRNRAGQPATEIKHAEPINSQVLRSYLAFTVPTTLFTLIDAVVWQRSEVFFLQRLSVVQEIGYYSLAFTVFAMLMGMGLALINGYFPAISRDFGANDWVKIREKIRQGLLLAMVYATPLTLGALATMSGLIELLYGSKMLPAVPVTHILFVGLIPAVVMGVLGLTISAVNRPWLSVPLGIGTAVVNIVLDLLLIPPYGAIGAAVANVTAQVSFVVGLYFIVRRLCGVTIPWAPAGGILLVSLFWAYLVPVVVQKLVNGYLGLGLAIAIAVLGYAFSVLQLGLLKPLGINWSLPRRKSRHRILHLMGERDLPRNPDQSDLSGLVQTVLQVAKGQQQRGHEVWVATVGPKGWQTEWSGVRLVCLPIASWARLRLGRWELDLRTHLPYVLLALRHPFDIIHAQQHTYMRGIRARTRIIHFHFLPLEGDDHPLGPDDLRLIVQESDAQLAVSQNIAHRLSEQFERHHLRGRIQVVYNGVDAERFDPQKWRQKRSALRTQWRIPDHAVIFLYTGAIVPGKGVIHLVRAFDRLRQYRPDAYLVLAGGGRLYRSSFSSTNPVHDRYEAQVQEALQAAIQAGRAQFLGLLPVERMPEVYAAADVQVVPSVVQEPLGLVALEAMATGRPVIASRTGGIPEIVNASTGLLVPPGDEEALEQAMLRLLEDPGQRITLGEQARQWAKSFSWERMVDQLEAIYADAGAGVKPPISGPGVSPAPQP